MDLSALPLPSVLLTRSVRLIRAVVAPEFVRAVLVLVG
jgi:hypothetical protein